MTRGVGPHATKQVSRETGSLRAVMDNPALPALHKVTAGARAGGAVRRIGIGDAVHIYGARTAPSGSFRPSTRACGRAPRPGVSEVFDRCELADWIGAWLDIGATFTARRLAAVPDEKLMLYLSQLGS